MPDYRTYISFIVSFNDDVRYAPTAEDAQDEVEKEYRAAIAEQFPEATIELNDVDAVWHSDDEPDTHTDDLGEGVFA